MNKKIEYGISLAIGVAAYLFWAIPFRCALNYHEEFQLFQTDTNYFFSHITQPGGFTVYISEFFIQFYNNYWIGALILAIELITIQLLTLKILKKINKEWNKHHPTMIYAISLIPMSIIWIVIGDINIMHSLVIAVIIALALVFALICTTQNITQKIVGGLLAIAFYMWTSGTSHHRIPETTLSFSNIYDRKTYELLDYDLLVRSNRWDQIIKKAEKKQPNLPLSVCATNLALGMTNQMGYRGNEFFQNGTEGLFPSFNKDHFSTLTTAEVYFQLGLINTAQRLYFEAMEASPNYTKSCRCIRRLAETNLINGHYGIARKYLHILEKTTFYKKWAQRALTLIDEGETAILKHPLYGRLRQMRLKDDFLFSDREIDKICGRLVIDNHDNVLAMQYMLFCPILENNYEKFVQYMRLIKSELPRNDVYASFEKYLRKQ